MRGGQICRIGGRSAGNGFFELNPLLTCRLRGSTAADLCVPGDACFCARTRRGGGHSIARIAAQLFARELPCLSLEFEQPQRFTERCHIATDLRGRSAAKDEQVKLRNLTRELS